MGRIDTSIKIRNRRHRIAIYSISSSSRAIAHRRPERLRLQDSCHGAYMSPEFNNRNRSVGELVRDAAFAGRGSPRWQRKVRGRKFTRNMSALPQIAGIFPLRDASVACRFHSSAILDV